MTRGLVVFESMFGNTQVIGPLVDGEPERARRWGERAGVGARRRAAAARRRADNDRAEQSPWARAR